MIEALLSVIMVLLLTAVVMLGVLLSRRTIGGHITTGSGIENCILPNLSTRPENPANLAHISTTKDYLQELSQIGTSLCIVKLHPTIPERFQRLEAFLAENKDNVSLMVIKNFISEMKVADIRTDMERSFVEIMELILFIYSNEFLPLIFDAIPDASHLKSKYALTEACMAQESLNGQNALRRNLAPVYSELNELARVQEQLISSFPQLQATLGDGSTDWGAAALKIGAAGLTVAHPLFGIPLLISRLWGDKKEEKIKAQFAELWGTRLGEYWHRWNLVCTRYESVLEHQARFIEEKMRDVSERAIPRILVDLDAQGFDLEKVPARYREFLQEIRQKHGITK